MRRDYPASPPAGYALPTTASGANKSENAVAVTSMILRFWRTYVVGASAFDSAIDPLQWTTFLEQARNPDAVRAVAATEILSTKPNNENRINHATIQESSEESFPEFIVDGPFEELLALGKLDEATAVFRFHAAFRELRVDEIPSMLVEHRQVLNSSEKTSRERLARFVAFLLEEVWPLLRRDEAKSTLNALSNGATRSLLSSQQRVWNSTEFEILTNLAALSNDAGLILKVSHAKELFEVHGVSDTSILGSSQAGDDAVERSMAYKLLERGLGECEKLSAEKALELLQKHVAEHVEPWSIRIQVDCDEILESFIETLVGSNRIADAVTVARCIKDVCVRDKRFIFVLNAAKPPYSAVAWELLDELKLGSSPIQFQTEDEQDPISLLDQRMEQRRVAHKYTGESECQARDVRSLMSYILSCAVEFSNSNQEEQASEAYFDASAFARSFHKRALLSSSLISTWITDSESDAGEWSESVMKKRGEIVVDIALSGLQHQDQLVIAGQEVLLLARSMLEELDVAHASELERRQRLRTLFVGRTMTQVMMNVLPAFKSGLKLNNPRMMMVQERLRTLPKSTAQLRLSLSAYLKAFETLQVATSMPSPLRGSASSYYAALFQEFDSGSDEGSALARSIEELNASAVHSDEEAHVERICIEAIAVGGANAVEDLLHRKLVVSLGLKNKTKAARSVAVRMLVASSANDLSAATETLRFLEVANYSLGVVRGEARRSASSARFQDHPNHLHDKQDVALILAALSSSANYVVRSKSAAADAGSASTVSAVEYLKLNGAPQIALLLLQTCCRPSTRPLSESTLTTLTKSALTSVTSKDLPLLLGYLLTQSDALQLLTEELSLRKCKVSTDTKKLRIVENLARLGRAVCASRPGMGAHPKALEWGKLEIRMKWTRLLVRFGLLNQSESTTEDDVYGYANALFLYLVTSPDATSLDLFREYCHDFQLESSTSFSTALIHALSSASLRFGQAAVESEEYDDQPIEDHQTNMNLALLKRAVEECDTFMFMQALRMSRSSAHVRIDGRDYDTLRLSYELRTHACALGRDHRLTAMLEGLSRESQLLELVVAACDGVDFHVFLGAPAQELERMGVSSACALSSLLPICDSLRLSQDDLIHRVAVGRCASISPELNAESFFTSIESTLLARIQDPESRAVAALEAAMALARRVSSENYPRIASVFRRIEASPGAPKDVRAVAKAKAQGLDARAALTTSGVKIRDVAFYLTAMEENRGVETVPFLYVEASAAAGRGDKASRGATHAVANTMAGGDANLVVAYLRKYIVKWLKETTASRSGEDVNEPTADPATKDFFAWPWDRREEARLAPGLHHLLSYDEAHLDLAARITHALEHPGLRPDAASFLRAFATQNLKPVPPQSRARAWLALGEFQTLAEAERRELFVRSAEHELEALNLGRSSEQFFGSSSPSRGESVIMGLLREFFADHLKARPDAPKKASFTRMQVRVARLCGGLLVYYQCGHRAELGRVICELLLEMGETRRVATLLLLTESLNGIVAIEVIQRVLDRAAEDLESTQIMESSTIESGMKRLLELGEKFNGDAKSEQELKRMAEIVARLKQHYSKRGSDCKSIGFRFDNLLERLQMGER